MSGRLRELSDELEALRSRLREGGGAVRIERQHAQGKLTARERIELLLDPGSSRVEVGLLVAHDRYDGQAPAAGVVTMVGRVHGREVVVVANDATVKAGAWWPETITKILRAQEIAMRCRIPILYLVDSAGVNLPYQGGVFPGQYGAARIFQYNSIMRRYLRIPQLAAVMGPCIAGGAYLPALSDSIIMVEGTSFMGLGGPNLVKGATGQVVERDPEGRPLRMAGVHVDVSARRELEQALAAESELLQALTETSVSGILAFDETGRIVFANPEAGQVLGIPERRLLGRPCNDPNWEITTLDGRPMTEAELPFHQVMATRAPVRDNRHAIRLSDGRLRMLSVNAAPLPRRPMGASVVCAVTDITEQIENERALKGAIAHSEAQTERYRHMARLSRSWIWEADKDLRITHLSKSYALITGLDPARVMGRKFDEIRAETDLEVTRTDFAALDASIAARAPFSDFVYGLRRAEGYVQWMQIDGEPIFDAYGRFTGYRGAGSDVTPLYEMRMWAEEASKAKSDFLAMMSHEIRTPLNGILGMAELVHEHADTPEMREKIAVIRDSGEALLSVLNDVLDLSRIDVGRLEFDNAPFDPAEIAQRTCALHHPRAQEKGLDCSLDLPEQSGPLRLGDANRVAQIVNNLVSNAVKFTEAGQVALEIENLEEGPLRLTVRDTGIGMSPEQSERVFQPFVQADTSIARRFGGTGLGLSIVRRLVDLMQGKITIESVEGKGTRVSVELPLPAVAAAAESNPAAPSGICEDQLRGMRVLVAEDNRTNLIILRAMLESLGVQAEFSEDGRAACAAWADGRFDALLFDINMPDMDGRTALATLRARAQAQGVTLPPAAAITAAAMAHEVEAHAACGFVHTLTKPFRKDELARVLAALRASPAIAGTQEAAVSSGSVRA